MTRSPDSPGRCSAGFDQLTTPDWIVDPQALRVDGRIVDAATLLEVRLSAVEFWTNWIVAALWFGDGYLYVPVRDEQGAPKPPLWQLHPYDIQIRDGTYWVNEIPLPVGSIIHLRGRAPYWNGHGRGVITEHGADLGLAATLRIVCVGDFQYGRPGRIPEVDPTEHDPRTGRRPSKRGGWRRTAAPSGRSPS